MLNVSKMDDLSRRHFMSSAAKTALGVSVLPYALGDTAAEAQIRAGAKAKQIIYLFMTGAMSHLDTFDPKPKSDVQGDTGVIKTKIPGVQFSEHMTGLAQNSDKLAVIRSLSTSTGAHGPARYLARTSYKPIATTRHPGLGSWMHKLAGKIHKDLPPTVQIGGGVGPGYLGANYAPVPIGDPAKGIQNTKSPAYLTDKSFDKRMQLSALFDSGFRRRGDKNSKLNGYDDLYRDAINLLRSEDLQAFDITKEPEAAKKAYGTTRFGKGALLARRLIENGVRYVEVSFGGWDHHNDLFGVLPDKASELDRVVTTLIKDLQDKRMLNSTLIVIGTEFGRKPKINQRNGRDHHPAAFSAVLAGGGIKGGQVYGKTDADGFYVDDDSATVEDLNATIAYAAGLPYEKEIFSPDGRPFKFANDGVAIKKLF
jgi:hypothetical protein